MGSSKSDLNNFRPANLFSENPTDNIRRPTVDVGEFLPSFGIGIVEVARISLESVTGDVISFRVRKTPKKFALEIIDEYGSVFVGFKRLYNDIPTQGELFNAARDFCYESDGQSIILGTIEMNELTTIDEIIRFFYFDSNIYPNLNQLFEDYLVQIDFQNE
jgi:hypothetical protein